MSEMSFGHSVPTSLSAQTHAVDGKMIIKVQYQNHKKYVKLQTPDVEEFISEGKCPDWNIANQ